jgi:hypothetical protein
MFSVVSHQSIHSRSFVQNRVNTTPRDSSKDRSKPELETRRPLVYNAEGALQREPCPPQRALVE